jgi:hypothetical protein
MKGKSGMTYTGENPDGQFRADVLASGETSWASNALRFDTKADALAYARNLASRWLSVIKVRAVEISTPAREPYITGSEDESW